MKRAVIVGSLIALVGFGAMSSESAITVQWDTPFLQTVLFQADGTTPLPASSLYIGFWSPTADYSGFDPANPSTPLAGGTKVLTAASTTIPALPLPGMINGAQVTADTAVGGYAFVAVFDMPFASYAGSVPAGTQYGLGPVSIVLPESPPATQYAYGELITTGSPLSTNLRVVPEPTVAFLGLIGVGTIVFRRLRRKDD